jgi:uncharacterized protein YprB with RNaseH-like and TPR domain
MSAEDIASRLRRLRRDGPPMDAAPAGATSAIRDVLARRESRVRRAAPFAPGPSAGATGESAVANALDADRVGRKTACSGLPSGLEHSASGESVLLARGETFAREHRHGAMLLAEAAHADPRAFAILARDRRLDRIDLETALYLDTETSGLSGGSGTYVFMVGLGSFGEDGFRVWQGFLDDPAHERELLTECAERIRRAPAIVSFFGKSFDRHRLEDRMRCLGIAPPFEAVPHLDLYHPLRRLYRGDFPDHRLRTLESELCGFDRDDDLPGSMAPAAWFDFLAGRPHRLEGVFLHNRDDVLSLVTLGAHLGNALKRESREYEKRGASSARDLNLARTLAEAGDRRFALEVCDGALARQGADPRRDRPLRVLRAGILRRAGEGELAIAALRELSRDEEEDELSASVLLELARLEFRGSGDDEAARAACTQAAIVAARRHTGRDLARCEREIVRLRARLEKRAASRSRAPRALA